MCFEAGGCRKESVLFDGVRELTETQAVKIYLATVFVSYITFRYINICIVSTGTFSLCLKTECVKSALIIIAAVILCFAGKDSVSRDSRTKKSQTASEYFQAVLCHRLYNLLTERERQCSCV